MTKWRYPGYLPKPPHFMSELEWSSYANGLTKQQHSDRYSNMERSLIPTYEMVQAQDLGNVNPDPYKRTDALPTVVAGVPQSNSYNVAGTSGKSRALPTDITLDRMPSARELNGHYLDGEGESISVSIDALPLDEIDWSPIKEKMRGLPNGYSGPFNDEVLVRFPFTSGYAAFGQMKFDLFGDMEIYSDGGFLFDGTVSATGGGDMYDFEWHEVRGVKDLARNIGASIGKPRFDREDATEPQKFFINISGSANLSVQGER